MIHCRIIDPRHNQHRHHGADLAVGEVSQVLRGSAAPLASEVAQRTLDYLFETVCDPPQMAKM